MYVSATRGRHRTVFVADARDWLSDTEMRTSLKWQAGQLDDEVLDRFVARLSGRPERIDSPSQAMRSHWEPPRASGPSHGMGMSL
jgi:hypothetical protein